MKYSKVLHDAWDFASNNKKLVWFAFLPSFVTVLIFVAESSWQGFMLMEEFGKIHHGSVYKGIGNFFEFLSNHHLWTWFILLLFVIFLFAFVFPALIQAGIILSIRQKFTTPDKRISLRQKIIEGGSYFFKMFEFHAIMSPFSFLSIIFYFLAFYRYSHGDTSNFLFTVMTIIALIAIPVNLFFAYTPFYLVCEKEDLGPAMRKSIGLVFLNLGKTIGLIMLMLLVNLRVIINVLVVFGVPAGIIYITTLFTKSDWLYTLSITGGILGGILALWLAAYLTAILEVFSLGFWERAFTQLRKEQQKLEFTGDEEPEEIETITAERMSHENPAAPRKAVAKFSHSTEPQPAPAEPIKIAQEIRPPHPNKPETAEENTSIHFKVE